MEALQRLQALDILLVVLVAAVVAWGFGSGLIRQLSVLVAVFLGAVAASFGTPFLANLLSQIFSTSQLQMTVLAYPILFLLVAGIGTLLVWRAYPYTAIRRGRALDRLLGMFLAATWSTIVVILTFAVLSTYTAAFWPGQETHQQTIRGQLQFSQLAPLLEIGAAPLWSVVSPWFPPKAPRSLAR